MALPPWPGRQGLEHRDCEAAGPGWARLGRAVLHLTAGPTSEVQVRPYLYLDE